MTFVLLTDHPFCTGGSNYGTHSGDGCGIRLGVYDDNNPDGFGDGESLHGDGFYLYRVRSIYSWEGARSFAASMRSAHAKPLLRKAIT